MAATIGGGSGGGEGGGRQGHSVAGLGYGWAGVNIEVFWRIPAILCDIRVLVHLSGFEGKSDEMQEINGKGTKRELGRISREINLWKLLNCT